MHVQTILSGTFLIIYPSTWLIKDVRLIAIQRIIWRMVCLPLCVIVNTVYKKPALKYISYECIPKEMSNRSYFWIGPKPIQCWYRKKDTEERFRELRYDFSRFFLFLLIVATITNVKWFCTFCKLRLSS